MSNIIDYVKDYGHNSFFDKPFNKVDALVLSQFSYLKLDSHVPQVGTLCPGVSVYDIASSSDADHLFTDERYK